MTLASPRFARRVPATVLFAGLALAVPAPLLGQVTVGVRIGAVGSSPLVRDSIVEPITVTPDVAPLLGLRVEAPRRGRYVLGVEVAVSRSDLVAHGDTSVTTVTALTLWSPSVGLRAAATSWLAVEARLGAHIYDPGQTEGTLFSEGAPVEPMLGLGLAAERTLGKGFAAILGVQYDAHGFSTTALQSRGFTGKTIVHRVGLSVTLRRQFSRAPATP